MLASNLFCIHEYLFYHLYDFVFDYRILVLEELGKRESATRKWSPLGISPPAGLGELDSFMEKAVVDVTCNASLSSSHVRLAIQNVQPT
jgi:hypothetical protein